MRTMTLLRNDKLVRVDLEEQSIAPSDIVARKMTENGNPVEYWMIRHTWEYFHQNSAYNWKVIKCPHADNSSLGNRYSVFETKGEAIERMLRDGFTVTVNGVEIQPI